MFPAITCFFARDNTIPNVAFCICPPGVVNAIWELSDAFLPNNIADGELKGAIPFVLPPIKKAYSAYSSMSDETPVKQFSSTCFQDHYSHWNSSIALYMTTEVDPSRGNQHGPNVATNNLTVGPQCRNVSDTFLQNLMS